MCIIAPVLKSHEPLSRDLVRAYIGCLKRVSRRDFQSKAVYSSAAGFCRCGLLGYRVQGPRPRAWVLTRFRGLRCRVGVSDSGFEFGVQDWGFMVSGSTV